MSSGHRLRFHQPQLLVCMMTVQRSSRSMLMESRVMSSGSFATAGIVSAAHAVFYHIPRQDPVMCGTEGELIKTLSWSKLIDNCMDRNSLIESFCRPEHRKTVPALPVKLHHAHHLHRQPLRVDSLIEDGTTTHIVRQ